MLPAPVQMMIDHASVAGRDLRAIQAKLAEAHPWARWIAGDAGPSAWGTRLACPR
jgi:hypothetical protein